MNAELFTTLVPDEYLDRAESYMLAKEGAITIEERTETHVVFSYRLPFGAGESCMILLGALATFGVVLLYVAFRLWFKQEVRLIVRPTAEGKTRLLLDGKTKSLRNELREWAECELATPGAWGETSGE